jgi:hypothetical protein
LKEPNWKTCTEEELWKYVAQHLAENGISTILVGGAVASIYSEGAYRSGDLDLIVESLFTVNLPKIMKQIGFVKKTGRHYKHPKCSHIFIEFCSPPVAIGDDIYIKPAEVHFGGQILKLYNPTDCIRDRLASYIHFKSRDCLDQAVLVAKNQPFNAKKIKKWCESEGASSAYQDFLKTMKASKSL